MMLKRIFGAANKDPRDPAAAYQRHLTGMLRRYDGDRDRAFAAAVGSDTVEAFVEQGDGQVAVLRHHGLIDGMSIYDLGCGCGRTAQALRRANWQGRYVGADIVEEFIAELVRKCPGFEAHVHREPTILAESSSVDLVFHWSVFTHLQPEESYLYLVDIFRALRPGGKLVFSFMELSDPHHYSVFETRVQRLRDGNDLPVLDTFLHRDWIELWAAQVGFTDVRFTDGQDASRHPPMWQTLVTMAKPLDA